MENETSSTIIRRMTAADVPAVMQLVRALAEYEKELHWVTNTAEQMLRDGFGEQPLFSGFVATHLEDGVIGMAIYYYRYSTWVGRVLYLEDLYVCPLYRGTGLGLGLLKAIVQQAHEDACARVAWQVLDWNTPAIDFYKRLGANFDDEWINVFLTQEQFAGLLHQ